VKLREDIEHLFCIHGQLRLRLVVGREVEGSIPDLGDTGPDTYFVELSGESREMVS
jgi:hypothetical protein